MSFDDTKGKLKTKVDPVVTKINRLHQECCASMRTTLQKAIALGKLLVTQKEKCGHGKWLPWIEANLKFGERQVQRYIRCYDNREKLPKATSKSDFTSLEEFLSLCEEPIVAELVKPSREAQLINIPGQERPLLLGGKPLAISRGSLRTDSPEVVDRTPNLKRANEHLALACRFAQLGGISGEELTAMLQAHFPIFKLNQTQKK